MKKKKVIPIIMGILIIFLLVVSPLITTNAEDVGTPSIDISLKAGYPAPNPAEIDDEIEVVYTVKTGDIKVNDIVDDSEKDIVFAIDTSESMFKCIEHDKYINHRPEKYSNQCTEGCTQKDRRIELVKVALNNFISTLKEVENVRVGIVTYSKWSEIINANNGIYYSLDNDNEYNKLQNVINNLSAAGSTNTGDGLRQAVYALNKGTAEDKNKTLIFFTDGEPSVYSINNKQEYKMSFDGTVMNDKNIKDDKEKSLDYAINIGEKMAANYNYNIISIACALGQKSNQKIKEIHNAMNGKDNSIYLANNNEALNNIFKQVAEELKESFIFDGVKLNIPKEDTFSILSSISSITQNDLSYTIDIGKINYKLNKEKMVYEAADFDVSFKIKAAKEGTITIGNNSTVTYMDLDNKNIKKNIGAITVEVVSNNTPNIKAELDNACKTPTVFAGNEVTVRYNISADSFEYKGTNGYADKEIAILIDTSSGMSNAWAQCRNGIVNELLNGLIYKDEGKITYKIITYNNEVYFGDEIKTTDKDQNGVAIDYRDKLQQKLNGINIDNSSSKRNLGKALKETIKYFNENGKSNTSKNIVIIGSGDSTDSVEEIKDTIKNNFNVITLDVNRDGNSTEYNDLSLKKCHDKISSEDKNYFERTDKDTSYNSIANTVSKEMAARIKKVFFSSDFIVKNAVLNFDLGDELSLVEGLKLLTGSRYIYELPDLVFKAKINENGLYTYSMNPFEITFKIKTNENSSNTICFGNANDVQYNNLSYIKINNKELKKKIDTPQISLISLAKDLKHGLYEGINNGTVNIDTSNNKEFAAETNINFAANFKLNGNAKATLKLDTNGKINGTPRIFKVENNSLVSLSTATYSKKNESEYEFDIKDVNLETQILILYGYKITGGQSVENIINNITVSTSNADATVKVKKDSNGKDITLPDLF